jgi:hypothetical protein
MRVQQLPVRWAGCIVEFEAIWCIEEPDIKCEWLISISEKIDRSFKGVTSIPFAYPSGYLMS